MKKPVTARSSRWRLTAQEAAHAMPVLQWAHPGLRSAPAPTVAIIRCLAQRSGIRDGTLRTALSRACASGALRAVDGRYRLGPLSIEQAAAARSLASRRRGYVLGAVLEGKRVRPPRLRDLFLRLGFRPLQRSLWVGARTKDDRLSVALRRAGLGGSVVVFQADEVDADARRLLAKVWRLDARAVQLGRFHRELQRYLDEPHLDDVEVAWRCVEVAPIWYRVVIRDEPPFPLDLAGAGYPLADLHAAWRAHLAANTHALVSLFRGETS